MSAVVRCDNCRKEVSSNQRYVEEFIHVEHNEDALHFDACSWACCAELAMRRAADEVTT